MRSKKPVRTTVDQVRITREGDAAIIDFVDPGIATVRLTVGPAIDAMTDREIVDLLNGVVAAQERLLAGWDRTVVEITPGGRQIEYHRDTDQWSPRADVLRCVIGDGGPDRETTFRIDDHELSLREFGRLLCVHAGWGMRIAFVPEEFVTENPTVEIRKARRRKA